LVPLAWFLQGKPRANSHAPGATLPCDNSNGDGGAGVLACIIKGSGQGNSHRHPTARGVIAMREQEFGLYPGQQVHVDDPYISFTGIVTGIRNGFVTVRDEEDGEKLTGPAEYITPAD